MVMGDDQIVTTIQSDADNRPTRYAIVNTDGSQISFDIHYSDPVDGEALGHPANIETKGFSSALSAEDIKKTKERDLQMHV